MSGRVNVLQAAKIFDSADISGDLTSEAFDITHVGGASVQFEWTTADVTGPLALEVRNNKDASFVAIPDSALSSTAEIDGADGTGYINIEKIHGYEMRVTFTNTAGSAGTLDAWIGGKAL